MQLHLSSGYVDVQGLSHAAAALLEMSSSDSAHWEIPGRDSDSIVVLFSINHIFRNGSVDQGPTLLGAFGDIFPMTIPICQPQILAIQYHYTHAVFTQIVDTLSPQGKTLLDRCFPKSCKKIRTF